MRRRRKESSADPPEFHVQSRHRSSSFSHASVTESYGSTAVAAAAGGSRSRMTTTFSAEGGDSESSLTTISSYPGEDIDQAKINILSLLSSTATNSSGKQIFDIRAETDLLRNRTEQLVGDEEDEGPSQQEWVI